jgi:hypothetical protein
MRTPLGTIELSIEHQELRMAGTRVQLEPPGTVAHVAGLTCGSNRGIARAYLAAPLVVVVPRVELGGDGCVGLPSADLAVAITRGSR